MRRGTVVKYDANLGYGFIALPGVSDEIYVHRTALGEKWSCLAPGEEVEFEVHPNHGRPQAGAVRSLLEGEGRIDGIVCDWDSRRGTGHICRTEHRGDHTPVAIKDGDPCEGPFFHHSDILSGTSRTMKLGERVTYETRSDDRGPRAVRIKRLDPRFAE